MKADPRSKRRHAIAALIALAALMASCDNILETIPRKDTGGGTGGGGTLTAVARLAGSARHALPSVPALAYGALLYHDASSQGDFSSGIVSADGASVAFAFQTPSEQSGLTLEVFAFADGTERADFSREGALLCGKKGDVEIQDNKITAEVALLPNKDASAKGTASLKVKVPPDCALEIDDTANFAFTDDSPDAERTYTVTQKDAGGIMGGAYALTFTVKKGGGVVHVFSEHINVFPGMVTDTWSGLSQGEAREVTQAMLSTTVYVRGAGGWYDGSADFKDTAAASDDNPGSLMRPFATIQKAVDTIIARNDGSSAYTILVDGTLDGKTAPLLGANGMADFSALDKDLKLTIKALDATKKATLDGGARLNDTGAIVDAGIKKSVIYAKPKVTSGKPLTLALESLVITGGNATENGGGIYASSGTYTVTACEISGNTANASGGGVYVNSDGTLTMTGGTISGNNAYSSTYGGGGVYSRGTFTMDGGTISGNTATKNGGGIYNKAGTLKLTNVNITGGGDIASPDAKNNGGGICNSGTLTIEGGKIKDCVSGTAGGIINIGGTLTCTGVTVENCIARGSEGGGIENYETSASGASPAIATLTDCTITGCKTLATEYRDYRDGGGGINNQSGTLTLSGGRITGCSSIVGGGITNIGGKLVITGGAEISGNKIEGSTAENNGGGIKIQSGNVTLENGTISDNKAVYWGGGVYVNQSGTLTMNGGTISGNAAKSGGGIGIRCTSGTGNVTITGGTITNNTASEYGGGVYNLGTLIQNGGEISNNTATRGGGGVYNSTTYIINGTTYNDCKGSFTMTGGTISSNTATTDETATPNGGGVCFESGSFTMSGGEISDNTAKCAGGGVYFKGTAFTMSGTAKISGNKVTYASGGHGGGVSLKSGTFTIAGGEISGNTSTGTGGGVYSSDTLIMKGGTVSTNEATTNGGGVYVNSGTFTMEGGTITSNKATGTTDDSGGGGIYAIVGSRFTMSGGTFSGNTAQNGNGAFVAEGSTMEMGSSARFASDDDVYLYDDTTTTAVPTIQIVNALTGTTPVATITPYAYAIGKQVLSGAATTLADNHKKFALSEDGWAISAEGKLVECPPDIYVSSTGNDDTGSGTASAPYKTLQKAFDLIKVAGSSTVSYTVHISGTVSGTTTIAFGLPAARVLITGTSSASDILDGNSTGSVLTVSCAATVEIKNVKITNGSATKGGGIYLERGEVRLGQGAVVSGNRATGDGGGVYSQASFYLVGGEISGNTAGNDGGGVCINTAFFIMSSGKISNNRATGQNISGKNNGGGVMQVGGDFKMTGGEISGNESDGGGGGVYTDRTFTMTGGKISGNTSKRNGGGVHVYAGTFTLKENGEITNNTSIGQGGGVYSRKFYMEGGTISGNTAGSSGGGVYNVITFEMSGGTITGNTASSASANNVAGSSWTQTGGTIG